MKNFIFSLITFSFIGFASAQVGIGTNTPENSAVLDLSATDKGILFPRMTTGQRIAIAAPANGLHVFDLTTTSLWFYNGANWINYATQSKLGDVKSGIHLSDHEGWIILNGRSIATLSLTQQTAASSLGLSGNLPNAANAYLSQNGGIMGAVAGANTVTLIQANLPAVNFPVTVADAGAHTHSVDPASVNTNTTGSHTHSISRRGNPDSGAYDNNNDRSTENSAITSDRSVLGTFNVSSSGDHFHTVDIPATTSTSNGVHTHTVTVSSGGSATALNIAPRSLTVNMFVYLGQ
jgi:hypothetical protein